MRLRRHLALGTAAALATLTLGGCLILPVPAKTRIEGAMGPAKLDIKECGWNAYDAKGSWRQ